MMDDNDPTIQNFLVKLTGDDDVNDNFVNDLMLIPKNGMLDEATINEIVEGTTDNLPNSELNDNVYSQGTVNLSNFNVDKGSIIIDSKGNYYFQSIESLLPIEALDADETCEETEIQNNSTTTTTTGSSKTISPSKPNAGENHVQSTTITTLLPSTPAQSINTRTIVTRSDTSKQRTNVSTMAQSISNDGITRRETRNMTLQREANTSELAEFFTGFDSQLCSESSDHSNDDEIFNNNEEVNEIEIAEIEALSNYDESSTIEPTKEDTPKSPKKSQSSVKEFKCVTCNYTTHKGSLLARHYKTHADDRPFKCTLCERGFKTTAAVTNHMNTHLGKRPHPCNDCEKRFTTSGELLRHVRYCHTGIKPHKCTLCDYSSVEMSKLKRHMRCHTGERPYQCPHCTYASPDSFKLKRHLRTHTGEKPYVCDICHGRFTQSNTLKYHRQIHSVNDKPVYQCSKCPTTCGRKTDLRTHIQKLHNTDKVWTCKRCNKELPDRYSYKVHVKTHEGEKCFRCEHCQYATTTQRYLESHLRIHSDEKPFSCRECNMKFRQKQLLNRHQNIAHSGNKKTYPAREKSHVCTDCGRSFTFRGNLIRHMEVHDLQGKCNLESISLKSTESSLIEYIEEMDDKDDIHLNIQEESDREASNYSSVHSNIEITYSPVDYCEQDEEGKDKEEADEDIVLKSNHCEIVDKCDIVALDELEVLEIEVAETIIDGPEKKCANDEVVINISPTSIEDESNLKAFDNDDLQMIMMDDASKHSDYEYIYEEVDDHNESMEIDSNNPEYDDVIKNVNIEGDNHLLDSEAFTTLTTFDQIVDKSNAEGEVVILEVIQYENMN